MKNKVLIFVVAAFIIVLGITFMANRSGSTPAPVTNPPVNNTTSYTLTEVETHASATSCWTIVRTNVYDLTPWIAKHPGGPEAILSICGKDGTAAFEAQHGGQREPEDELKNFQIGIYKQ